MVTPLHLRIPITVNIARKIISEKAHSKHGLKFKYITDDDGVGPFKLWVSLNSASFNTTHYNGNGAGKAQQIVKEINFKYSVLEEKQEDLLYEVIYKDPQKKEDFKASNPEHQLELKLLGENKVLDPDDTTL